MKNLLTISALLVSSLAMGQWPSLPYNPDDNADGLIGVVDLQALLANYGNEFASAVVSEDGESAIVYMGEMGYPLCAGACRELPGFWHMSEIVDLSLVWDEVVTSNSVVRTWIGQSHVEPTDCDRRAHYFYSPNTDETSSTHITESTSEIAREYRCYCAAKQLPRVEYFLCSTDQPEEMQFCVDLKVAEGWYPLGSPYWANDSGNAWNQALWRWAE